MTAEENGTARPAALGRGLDSLLDDAPAAAAPEGAREPTRPEDAMLCAAKLIGAAAAGTVAVAACTLIGMRAVLGMRVRGRG